MDCVYFSLNHWSCGTGYPDAEPFISWMSDCYETKEEEEKSWVRDKNALDKYCKDNELVMVVEFIDMSISYSVSAKREWVEKTCPDLLTKYSKFVYTGEDGEPPDYGAYGCPFLEYSEKNIGVHYYDEDEEKFVDD